MTSFPTIESSDAGLDWVTCVTEDDRSGEMLRRIAEQFIGLAEKVKAWRMRGYNGRCGYDLRGYTGGLAYGENYTQQAISYLAQAWGSVSTALARQVVASNHVRVSRLDYAVTVLFAQQLPPIGKWDINSEIANSYRLTRIVPNDDGGGTLYVGARGSDVFGRVYDKGAQLGSFPERIFWRWEVEYKRDHAKQAYANWSENVNDRNAYEAIAHEVSGWYTEHGIPIPLITEATYRRPVIRYATRVRTSDTTVEWMYQQVNPALRKMEMSGRLADALDALGVWDNQLVMTESELRRLAQWEQTDFLASLEGHAPEV
jgi:hypothetical protein